MEVKHFVLATLFCTMFSDTLFSQKLEPLERSAEPDHVISSVIMDKEYQLYISFPKSYNTEDAVSYPVLYFLDGLGLFPIFQETQKVLSLGNEVEEVIIVGIGSGFGFGDWFVNRAYDYTPSSDPVYDRERDIKFGFPTGTLKSGGGEDFLRCIQTEIIPFIDKSYKTNGDRGIAGISFGGLFATYCLVNSDGYFTKYGIGSPSLWWDNEKLLDQIASQFTTHKTWEIPATEIFISVGEEEGHSEVAVMLKLYSYLADANYENVTLSWQVFDKETHLSVIPATVSKIVSTLYGKE